VSSSVPLAVPAFKDIATAALPGGTYVWTGKQLSRFISPVNLQICQVQFHEDAYAELGPSFRHEEHYDIICELKVFYGDGDFDQRLQDAYAYYALITSAVFNNPTLNSTVRLAWTRQEQFTPEADAFGKTMGCLDFAVECQARVTP
jgi:hypothetical protein